MMNVNMGQSSNDVFPTAMHISATLQIKKKLLPALQVLWDSLNEKSKDFQNILKIGRTHLQDATPITLGQEFSGYAEQIRFGMIRLENSLPSIQRLAIGGTAVGTGINTHPNFGKRVAEIISELTGYTFISADNKLKL